MLAICDQRDIATRVLKSSGVEAEALRKLLENEPPPSK
ncbi:MAG: hypothetical protein ACREJQ_00145 [bacterium]